MNRAREFTLLRTLLDVAQTLCFACGQIAIAQPIQLHPDNPHYFQFQDKPTLLVTGGEHYGAVINADFDYETSLKAMAEQGMNYTRIFVGAYVEVPGSFGIKHNTLAPAHGRFISPLDMKTIRLSRIESTSGDTPTQVAVVADQSLLALRILSQSE